MKKVLVVYAHPNPKSFNHAILEKTEQTLNRAGCEVRVKDLYSIGFDPILDGEDFGQIMNGKTPEDIKNEQADISWADRMVFIYPTWWFDRPAMLKGWIDRTFLNGFAFSYGPTGPQGLLKHDKALIFQTAGGPLAMYQMGHAEDTITRPMSDGTLHFCGIKDVTHKVLWGVAVSTPADREKMLGEVAELTHQFAQ